MTLDTLMQFPDISTERLLLRQMQADDAEALFAIKSNFEVTRHYGQEPHHSPADTLAWIERLRASFDRREDVAWGMTLHDEKTLIGACTLWNFGAGQRCAEIGYELHPAYEKRGLMIEAITGILKFGFMGLELHRIEATPFAVNDTSLNLLRRFGFVHEGTLRERYYFRGHFLDQTYFGLLRDDWLKKD